MKVTKLKNFKEIEEIALEHYDISKKEAYIYISELNGIITPSPIYVNKKLQGELNLETFYLPYIGGSIIIFPGDIEIVINSKNYMEVTENLFKIFYRAIEKKGFIGKTNHNDLVIDINGELHKVAATVSRFCHISVGTDSELVKSLCNKKSNKIPDTLLNFGFSKEEIYQIVEDVIKGN